MLDLINHQFVRGINPNLVAGQRSIKIAPSTFGGGLFIHQPNSPFYNFGNGPFTIYFRMLFLGVDAFDGGFNELPFINRAANGTGWAAQLKGSFGTSTENPLALEMSFFQGGQPCRVRLNEPWPLDGRFHSACIVRRTMSEAEAADVTNIKLFVDGVEIADRTTTGYMISFDSTNEMLIGGAGGAGYTSPNVARFLRGYLDGVSFYNRGLSDFEIQNLDSLATRTDLGARFIQDFNQLGGTTLYDSTSIGNNGRVEFSDLAASGRGFVLSEGIRTFAAGAALAPPLNGHFAPVQRTRITGISAFDGELTQVQYSLDGSTWYTAPLDATGLCRFAPALDLDPTGASPTLYLRASNQNAHFLNALELIY